MRKTGIRRGSIDTIMPTLDVVDARDVHEGYVAVAGAHLYFREIGSGPPMVILHGGPDFDQNYMLPEMDYLSTAFRLIYYDQRGRGQSSSGVAAEDVGIESEVDDLDRLRESIGCGWKLASINKLRSGFISDGDSIASRHLVRTPTIR